MFDFLPTPDGVSIQIAVIEDDVHLNGLICETLDRHSVPTRAFFSGEEVLKWVRKEKPGNTLFLVDLHLEDMGGEQLVRTMKNLHDPIAFIIMTGFGDERIAVDMMKMGALDYLVKDKNFISLLPSSVSQAMNHLRVQHQLVESRKAFKKSEQKYRLMADYSSDLIARFNWDQTFLYVSPACRRMLGFHPEELIGQPLSHMVHPDDLDLVRKNHDELINNKCDSQREIYRLRKANGEYLWVETNSQSVRNTESGLVEEIVGVARDISERKEKENLLKAKEVAEQASKAKSDFLANLSHEIRNPMNAIIGMANTLLKTPVDEKQKTFLNSILFSSRNLLGILNDILDYSRIEAKKVTLTYSSFRLRDMLDDTVNAFRPMAADKGITLNVQIQKEIPEEIYGDEQKINQILSNLLNNAIKFTPEGRVSLNIEMKEKPAPVLRFSVHDTGIGVKQEDIPHLFDSFRQLDISSRKEYQGTGLGLSIVKSLVELMHGSASFESEFGKGSVARFEIPLQGVAGDKPSGPASTPAEKNTLKILVAEDEAINQLYLSGFLRAQGWQVDGAPNGFVALDKYRSGGYDLILMDGQMPKMDGFEATRKIREIEKRTGKHTPIIAITGYAISGDRDRFLGAGMDEYISKPIDEEKLLQVIQRLTA
ncbi:MAG: response regulator [Bacteroidales bacterium]